MLVGYARVSTLDQNPELQIEALKEAGCQKIYVERISGATKDRPQLKEALNYTRENDTLVVWKLSRLARSITFKGCPKGTFLDTSKTPVQKLY